MNFFQIEPRKVDRRKTNVCRICLFYVCMEIVSRHYLSMGGELGNETYVGLFVGSSAKSSPIFALIGIADFNTNFVLNSW